MTDQVEKIQQSLESAEKQIQIALETAKKMQGEAENAAIDSGSVAAKRAYDACMDLCNGLEREAASLASIIRKLHPSDDDLRKSIKSAHWCLYE